MKLGQALSLRRDLLPNAYCSEFSKLLDRVPPFDFLQVAQVIEEDLGAPITNLFTKFDRIPVASASIGQVHLAWRDGVALAVKVQRPGIARRFRDDFSFFRVAAWICDKLAIGADDATFRDALEEFEAWTWRELDYREEAFSARLLAHHAAGSAIERHIANRPELSSQRVLTMELASGTALSKIVNAQHPARGVKEEPLRFLGLDMPQIAEHLLWSTLNQIYRFGVFHSDPHPANLFVLANSGVLYVDHGQVGRLGGAARSRLLRFAWSLAEERFDSAVVHLLEIARPSDRTDVAHFTRDAEFVLARHVQAMRYGTPVDRLATLPLDLLVMDLARRHRLSVASELTLFFKTISTVDSVVRSLVPQLDIFAIQRRFFAQLTTLELCENLDPGRQLATLRKVLDAFDEFIALPARLDDAGNSADRFVHSIFRGQRRLSFMVLLVAGGAGLFGLIRISDWNELLSEPVARVSLGCLLIIVVGHLVATARSTRLRDSYERSTGRRRGAVRRPAGSTRDG